MFDGGYMQVRCDYRLFIDNLMDLTHVTLSRWMPGVHASPFWRQGEKNPAARMRALARAYIDFALDEPAHFQLMFRKYLIDRDDARYQEASRRALGGFARAALSVNGARRPSRS